jgi:hypothetical protein
MLIQQPQDWTGVDNLQVIFCYLSYTWFAQLGVFHWIPPSAAHLGVSGFFYIFFKCFQFLLVMVKDQETVDHRFS